MSQPKTGLGYGLLGNTVGNASASEQQSWSQSGGSSPNGTANGGGSTSSNSILIGSPQNGTDLILNIQSNGKTQPLRLAVPDGPAFTGFTVQAGPYSADLLDPDGNSVGSRSYASYLGIPNDPSNLAATTLANDQATLAREVAENERDPAMQALTLPVLTSLTMGDPLMAAAFQAANQVNFPGLGSLIYPTLEFDINPSSPRVSGTAVPVTGAGPVSPSVPEGGADGLPSVRLVGGRNPINSAYAGQAYPLENLPPDLQIKYPDSVNFTPEGFPEFSPYAQAGVRIDGLTGDYAKDAAMANQAAGLDATPDGYVWHHVEDGQTMQLVPRDLHNAVKHTGGAATIRYGNK